MFLTADLLRFEFVSFANTADATAKIRGTLGVRIALTHQDDIARTVGLRLVTGVHAGLRPSRGPRGQKSTDYFEVPLGLAVTNIPVIVNVKKSGPSWLFAWRPRY